MESLCMLLIGKFSQFFVYLEEISAIKMDLKAKYLKISYILEQNWLPT